MTSEKTYDTAQRLDAHITAAHAVYPATGGLGLSAPQQTVPGLSAPLDIGQWRVHAQLLLSVPVTAGQGQLFFRTFASGGLTASGRVSIVETHAVNGVGASDFGLLGDTINGIAPGTSGANEVVKFDGYFVVSVAGTLNIQAAQASTAAVTIVQFGTYLEVFGVT